MDFSTLFVLIRNESGIDDTANRIVIQVRNPKENF